MNLIDQLKHNILVFDGAMGTMLHQKGLPVGEIPELYNLSHPQIVAEIHRSFADSGADIITANTFQANQFKIPPEYNIADIISSGVTLAKSTGKFVALDIGPLGQIIEPLGTFTFEQAYEEFRVQALAGESAGADCVICETFSDLYELKIAVLAIKENTSLPVFCTMTFEQNGRTFMGTDALSAVTTLEGMGIDAVGVNCSLGPKELRPIVDIFLEHSSIPVMVQANAGLPKIVDGKAVYEITPEEFYDCYIPMVEAGVKIVGGCCGTDPSFIKNLTKLRQISPVKKDLSLSSCATCATKSVFLQGDTKTVGACSAITCSSFLDSILDIADTDCDIIEVNLDLLGSNDCKIIADSIREIQTMVRVPLMIASSDLQSLSVATRAYNGKPILMLSGLCDKNMAEFMAIIKKYGAVGVFTPQNDADFKQEVDSILKLATDHDIPIENLIIKLSKDDFGTFSFSQQTSSSCLKTILKYKELSK